MTFDSAVLLAIAICLLTIKPGPGMLALVTRALADGFWPAFFIALGIVTVQAFFFVTASFSITLAEDYVATITNVMKAVGASYMFFLGYKGLSSLERGLWTKRSKDGHVHAVIKPSVLSENYIAGLTITLANPFVILFYVAVVPSILSLEALDGVDVFLATLIIVSINLFILTLEAVLAAQLREALRERKTIRIINTITSLCYIGIGLFLTYSLLPLFVATLGFGDV